MEGSLQANQVEAKVNAEPSKEEPTPPYHPLHHVQIPPRTINSDDKVVRPPCKFNLEDAQFSKEKQDQLLSLIYDCQKVFSFPDKDLGFCNKLAHSIPTMTDKSVYLPHRTIPPQPQGEVRKCLAIWLRLGIIRPLNSQYPSQVVTVRKKAGDIWLWQLHKIRFYSGQGYFSLTTDWGCSPGFP